jgi:8-oxo-dGTP pyrophosphatase MutT (NUDIX family)
VVGEAAQRLDHLRPENRITDTTDHRDSEGKAERPPDGLQQRWTRRSHGHAGNPPTQPVYSQGPGPGEDLTGRVADRRLLPAIWDIVGGHLEPGESPEQVLARELEEETGWRLRELQSVVTDWEHKGVVRRELDYLVTVASSRSPVQVRS